MTTSPKIESPESIPGLVSKLEQGLTTIVLAVMLGVDSYDETIIPAWRQGTSEPTNEQLGKMQLAYEVFFTLVANSDESTALIRFTSQVEAFGYQSYLGVIIDDLDPELIREAAQNQFKTAT